MGAGEVHFGEVAADVYTQSLVYVDCMSNAEHELQGLPQPLGMHELGSTIIKGNYPGEHSVTIFQSMGKYGTSFAICRKYPVLILSVILVFSLIVFQAWLLRMLVWPKLFRMHSCPMQSNLRNPQPSTHSRSRHSRLSIGFIPYMNC